MTAPVAVPESVDLPVERTEAANPAERLFDTSLDPAKPSIGNVKLTPSSR